MVPTTITIESLVDILSQSAGEPEGIDPNTNISDLSFDSLGYESLALLETIGQIERTYGVKLPDSILIDALTPQSLLDATLAAMGPNN
ncbi:acyl carrier protein [Glutamicibacter sp. 287]|uniref:acyl carrier protein n=1 Tax=Glutamicibacter TaxID=1742989 RepID=UPI000BB72AAF|nr:acyl carrier protein [Glutamicibacter sp. BW80]PCC27368.1 hypothetical protein CIK76_17185 [Glutamicibacter sp. BW80]